MDRHRLADLLDQDGADESSAAARSLRQGADYTFYEATATPAEHFATIYRRRAEHVREIGLNARGLEAAVARFEDATTVGALAMIHTSEREYPVFLTPDCAEVVACISVPAE